MSRINFHAAFYAVSAVITPCISHRSAVVYNRRRGAGR